MSNPVNNWDKAIQLWNKHSHDEVDISLRKQAFFDIGIRDGQVLDRLSKMKHGILTTVQIAIDLHAQSEAIGSFRLLSARDEIAIIDELDAMNLTDITKKRLLYIAKTLSRASVNLIQSEGVINKPEISESVFLDVFPVSLLLAIGTKYEEFVRKHSPSVDQITDEDISQVIDLLMEEESVIKKLDLLNGLSLKLIYATIITGCDRLLEVRAQMDKLSIT